jgi:tetratricopeptide (TPR) repeat protein
MKKVLFLFGLFGLTMYGGIIAQNVVNKDSAKKNQSDNLKTAEDYFERANIITKSKMFSLDNTTVSKAADDYLMAIKLNPKFWQARRNYARQMIYLKKYAIAIEQLNEALKIVKSEENPDLNTMRGQAFYELGKYKEAIIDFEIAIKYLGNSDYEYLIKAKAEWKLGRTDKACEDYYKAIKGYPDYEKQKEFIDCQ